LLGQRPGQLADDAPPVALRDLVLPGPEAAGERHHDLVLARPPLRLAGRAAHGEPPRWAPAELHACDGLLLACPGAVEAVRRGGNGRQGEGSDQARDLAGRSHENLPSGAMTLVMRIARDGTGRKRDRTSGPAPSLLPCGKSCARNRNGTRGKHAMPRCDE